MAAPIIPRNYVEWKRCITISCGIQLTPQFVEQRLGALDDPRDFTTQKYVQVWGEAQLALVRQWFLQARQELAQ